jgi:glycosyltransferase involved in cell wall biosynthesis
MSTGQNGKVHASLGLVSVVIPTHNRIRLLTTTLRSALRQRDVELEIIVVDDGSTDDTPDFLRSVGDPRVHVLRRDRPRGVSAARNMGIEHAQGDWIAFLDDDDLWAPMKLALQLRAGADVGSTWIYAGAVKIDGTQRIIGGTPPPTPEDVMARLPGWSIIPGGCSGVVVKRTTVARVGVFDERMVNLADWDLWIRLARTGPPSFTALPLVGYRVHAGQSSLDVGLILREAAILEEKHGTRLDRGALHHYLAHKCLIAGRRREALKHFARAGMKGQARQVASAGLSLVRGRLRRRFPSIPSRPPAAQIAWRQQAVPWLLELSGSAGVHHRDPYGS